MPLVLFIISVMMIAYGYLISYYHRGWKNLRGYEPGASAPSTSISVVIAARNEEKNINELLASLSRQDYPASLYEIIVVDDHSTDNTWQVLQDAKHVKAIQLENGAYKKFAIETGVRAATGTLIVTTDADCRFHPRWLSTLAAFYEEKKAKFIAAPVVMKKKKGLLAVFQSLDFITLQGITAASVHRRFHSMCNGANLAYERSVFFEVNGFEGIDHIPTGDDMLLMHKIYLRYPEQVFYLKSESAIVETEPAANWPAFFQQRIRWASKADQYQDKRITAVLFLVYFLNFGFLVLAVAGFWKSTWWVFVLMLLGSKILVESDFVFSVAHFFGRQRLLWYFPLLQPLHILYTIIAGWFGRFGSYKWKGRKVSR